MGYTLKSAFINREKELAFLNEWISEEPNNILFIFGPKSSGKTTLLYKFVNGYLNDKKYDVKFFNLREMFIVNYKDFIQAFFEIDYSKSKEDVREVRQYDLKVFKLSVESLKGIENKELDPFAVMKKELDKLNKKGIKPLIIIDELQALSNVYMNSQRELLKELFNFFVAITKEAHLCHVVISSSDGYFIERIYSDSRLLKTSRFMEVDYLSKEDVVYWLTHLKKESNIGRFSLTSNQIERVWYYFGGSVWEITNFLTTLMNLSKDQVIEDEILEDAAKKEIVAYKIRFIDYIGKHYDYSLFKKICAILRDKDSFVFSDLLDHFDRVRLKEELGILVGKNLFSYNPMTGEYMPQGHSIALGLKRFCEEENRKMKGCSE